MTCTYTFFLLGISAWTVQECRARSDDSFVNSEIPGSCANVDTSRPSPSLLQRVSHRIEKDALTTQHSAGPCTGVSAQGKCWYLSNAGESCATTCSKNGASFSFALADRQDPIMPKLLKWNRSTDVPWQPFAPLECLGDDGAHFHLASSDAAMNFVGDMGAWSHDECQLACPCGDGGRCEWKQPSQCAATFEWKGLMYTGCPTVDHDGPWCMHRQKTSQEDLDLSDWSHCIYSCAADDDDDDDDDHDHASENACFWKPASSCVAEFDYDGTRYLQCTTAGNHSPWCSNSDPYSGFWNSCEYVCPENTTEGNVKKQEEQICYWQMGSNCSSPFNYKGVDYANCTLEDNPTPWCSYDRIHNGFWSTCARVCTNAAEATIVPTKAPVALAPSASTVAPVPPEPATIAPMPIDHSALNPINVWEGEPCDRHPESENDYLGLEATLDEEGYKVTTLADSPLNMKRFICRVVAKIGCKVVDYSSLVGFVPYYSGGIAEQTYQHLEDELTILCHSGGKWVVALTPD